MSNLTDDQSSQASSVEENTKSAEDYQTKMNGLSEESAGSDGGAGGEPKQNGINGDKHSSSSSHKHGDGHHKSSLDKHHKSSSSHSSSKHGSSSNSSSKHKDGSSSGSSSKHHSSSSSKHRDGSSSKHSSSSSSSKSKEGSSSSSSHRDGKSSGSSKHKDGNSSSNKHSSSSSSKHKEGSSSSSSKHREDGKHSSSSSSDKDKHRDKSKESSSSKDKHRSSSSGDKHKSSSSSDKHKSSSSSGDKHKSSSSSSGDKHKSSSSGDKHRSSGDKHKSSSSSDKHKSSEEENKVKVKQEINTNHSNHDSVAEVKSEPPASPMRKATPSPIKKEIVSPVKREKPVVKYQEEEESEDEDKPLSVRINESRPMKRPKEESDYEDENEEAEDGAEEEDNDDDEDVPLSARARQAKKQKLDKKPAKAPKVEVKKEPKAVKKEKASTSKRKADNEGGQTASPTKKKKEEEQEVWRWWEEQSEDSGTKWTFLEHKGPVFAPGYERVPKNVRFYYEGKHMELSEETEEVATFYGRMLDHDYTTKDVFNTNFFKDWRKVMTKEEQDKIKDLKKCNFTEYNDYFKKKSEERKAMSKEEKQRIKKENEAITLEYGFCIIDHHKEKIGNFKIEPPGLFRGRGDHPKQGMLKRRVVPKDVIINCSKDSNIPKAPGGHKWKEVRHDNTVTWLASWTENIQGATKYVMLNAASKLKGQKDWQKYETARKLHQCVDKIRANYQDDWKSKEMRVRQRAVALYFIDKLALRAGNEKDGEESADTVGCCSLRVEHITLHEEKAGKSHVVEFDFLGKDSIRYQNSIPVEKRVFKNVQLFMENKSPEDDLFDRLNTVILNKHLQDLMDGLTAKVFRTYNASRTLSEQLELLTNAKDSSAAKLLSYNRANRAVAILCNHQRAVPKTFEKSMENLQKKIEAKNDDVRSVKKDIKAIKADYKQQKSLKTKTLYEKKKKTLARLEEQLTKLEVQATDKDENKEIALGTSKLNYLDPRISVAWCKKFEVPIEKVYNKTQRDKFRWAIDMATEHFKF